MCLRLPYPVDQLTLKVPSVFLSRPWDGQPTVHPLSHAVQVALTPCLDVFADSRHVASTEKHASRGWCTAPIVEVPSPPHQVPSQRQWLPAPSTADSGVKPLPPLCPLALPIAVAHITLPSPLPHVSGARLPENRARIRDTAAALSTVNQDPTMDEGHIDEGLEKDDREHAGDTGDD
jgi:hypothetical protein